jgi:sugar-specific transcriptional regulator TrmB
LKELLKSLRALGLTGYEARCYMALLGKSELTATDVSRISGVPRTRTYEILENLLKKGLCNSIPGPVVMYRAADPSILKVRVGGKMEKLREKINEYRKEIESCEIELANEEKNRDRAVVDLSNIYRLGQASTDSFTYKYVEIVRNPILHGEKMSSLISNSKKEILGLTKPGESTENKFVGSEQQALNKGVVCKNIYEIPKDIEGLESLIEEIDGSMKIGEMAKVVEYLPINVMVFDQEMVQFAAKDPVPHMESYTCMYIKNKVLAEFFKIAYDAIWDKAIEPDILPSILKKMKTNKTKQETKKKEKGEK